MTEIFPPNSRTGKTRRAAGDLGATGRVPEGDNHVPDGGRGPREAGRRRAEGDRRPGRRGRQGLQDLPRQLPQEGLTPGVALAGGTIPRARPAASANRRANQTKAAASESSAAASSGLAENPLLREGEPAVRRRQPLHPPRSAWAGPDFPCGRSGSSRSPRRCRAIST